METYIVVPKRDGMLTARVQAHYLPELQQVEVISRAITQMKLRLPAAWMPAKITWNGTEAAQADAPGCWVLEERKELLSARACGE